MNNPFYKLADTLQDKTRMLWGLLVVLAVGGFIIVLASNSSPTSQSNALANIVAAFLLLSAAIVFFLIPCIKTFRRLQSESGVFKAHRFREIIYTSVYTLLFCFITLAFLVVVYESSVL